MITNRALFFSHQAQTSDFPLAFEVVSAEGHYLYTSDDRRILDLISGISVSNIGHRHPEVVKAIKEQVDKHLFIMVYGEVIQSPQVKLAEKLCSLLPEKLNNVYFVNSGSEAIEGAMKLAKRYTGRPEIVSFKNAYHGSTQGALSLIGSEEYKNAFRPLLPSIKQLNFGSEVELKHITKNTAAVVIEPIQAEAGVRIPSKSYMKALRDKCDETGTLLIFDEIQTGFGRTGKWFAFEHFDIVPDVITIAKGMGGGMPIGAFISSKEIMSSLANNPILGHITTFGGHPVSCAASMAVIDVIKQENLIAGIESKQSQFLKLLKHTKIKEVRSCGLLIAVQLDSFDEVQKLSAFCLDKGVFTDWFLFSESSLRIAPPLSITTEEIDFACKVILEGLSC